MVAHRGAFGFRSGNRVSARPSLRNRRSSLCRSRWWRCGSHGVSNPTASSDTALASLPRCMSVVRCRLRRLCAWCGIARGRCSARPALVPWRRSASTQRAERLVAAARRRSLHCRLQQPTQCRAVGTVLMRWRPRSRHLERRGGSHRRLAVNYAFHSAQMAPLAAEFAGPNWLRYAQTRRSFHSTRRSTGRARAFPAARRRLLRAQRAPAGAVCRGRRLDAG